MLPKECIIRLITNHSILLCLVDCFSERHCSKHAVGPWGWTHGVAQGCFFGLGCISCGICYFYLFAITRHILLIIKITGNTVSIYIELQQMRSGHVEVFGGVPTSYMGFRYTAIWSLCNKGSFIYLFINKFPCIILLRSILISLVSLPFFFWRCPYGWSGWSGFCGFYGGLILCLYCSFYGWDSRIWISNLYNRVFPSRQLHVQS